MNQANSTTTTSKPSKGFTAAEKAAMRDRARELKQAATKEEGENAALAAIGEMHEPDRSMAKRIHAIIKTSAPELAAKTWYGMPAYARDDKVVCFFQPAEKFKARYATFGFNDSAYLDDGAMWPVAYALKELTADDEAKIVALLKRAAGRA